MQTGKLILLVGPSGSGKGSLLAYVREAFPDFSFPTTWTTRAPRQGEVEGTSDSGKKYRFVTVRDFMQAIEQGDFLEWDHHFGNYYGTPLHEVADTLALGHVVFHELEVNGAAHILAQLPREEVVVIFVSASSWEDQQYRILERQPDIPKAELELRRLRYEKELLFREKADYKIINEYGKLDETKQKLGAIIRTALLV